MKLVCNPRTSADYLLNVYRVSFEIGLETIAWKEGLADSNFDLMVARIVLAKRFHDQGLGFVLRALVEEMPQPTIVRELY